MNAAPCSPKYLEMHTGMTGVLQTGQANGLWIDSMRVIKVMKPEGIGYITHKYQMEKYQENVVTN